MRRGFAAVLGCALLLSVSAPVHAQSGENVAVVINDASAASQRIGEYYVRKRAVPSGNVIHIQAPTAEEITPQEFASTIEGPIAAAFTRGDLEDRILYIVLTKDVPLRIKGTGGQNGTVASVDSELTLLYRRMTGAVTAAAGPLANPYFLNTSPVPASKPFTHAEYDIYLVTRLDAFTVDEALRLVDKAAAPAARGRVVLDEKATLFNRTGEDWLEEAAKRLTDMGRGDDVLLDRAATPVRDVKEVLGYYSWGSNDPANRVRDFGVQFVPGALAATFVSSDARTFKEPPATWQPTSDWNDKNTWFEGSPQSLTADLIREGATGAAGHVAEPFLGATIRPQILFPAYMSGRNLAESFYLAMPSVSWQTVVVGDPLCRPFPSKPIPSSELDSAIAADTGLPKIYSARSDANAKLQYRVATDQQAALAVKAQARLAKGDTAGSKAAFAELVKAAPSSVAAQIRLADLLNNDKEYDAAIEHYRSALRLQANNPIALNNLAYILAVQKHSLDEAKELADQAIRLAPRDPSLADTAGWVAYLRGDYQRASRLLAQAATGLPDNAEIRLHAAFAYEAAGARAAALAQLDAATRLDPKLDEREDVKRLRRKLAIKP
jgi:uncharacterized protein (TIGR03790 family)